MNRLKQSMDKHLEKKMAKEVRAGVKTPTATPVIEKQTTKERRLFESIKKEVHEKKMKRPSHESRHHKQTAEALIPAHMVHGRAPHWIKTTESKTLNQAKKLGKKLSKRG